MPYVTREYLQLLESAACVRTLRALSTADIQAISLANTLVLARTVQSPFRESQLPCDGHLPRTLDPAKYTSICVYIPYTHMHTHVASHFAKYTFIYIIYTYKLLYKCA